VTSDVAHIRDKAVLIAAKLGFILFVDEFNSDRNLRLEGTLNQVLASGSGRDVHPNFFVICTGNPPRFHGRHKLPASLQTRFATVQLDPISHAELHDIIQQQVDTNKGKGRFPEQITESLADCDKIELWSRAFVAAKRKEPLLNLRALEGALKGNPQVCACVQWPLFFFTLHCRRLETPQSTTWRKCRKAPPTGLQYSLSLLPRVMPPSPWFPQARTAVAIRLNSKASHKYLHCNRKTRPLQQLLHLESPAVCCMC